MLLRVKTCSVCKWQEVKSWEELAKVRRVEMSWERGEVSWAQVIRGESRRGGKRWEELRRVEKSWDKVGRGESRWEELRRVEKNREEVKRVELRWDEMEQLWECWKEMRKLRRAEMVWEELRSGARNWKGVRQRIHRTELRSCEGPLHLLANLVFGS